jgi:hypothetical protein
MTGKTRERQDTVMRTMRGDKNDEGTERTMRGDENGDKRQG